MVETYRQQQENALTRERRLHIEAAAAQLLTLQRLEIERERRATTGGLIDFVDNNHVKVASADSGGGGMPNLRQDSTQSDLSFDDDRHHPQVHFEDSVHSYAPPTQAFAHSSGRARDHSRRQQSPMRHVDSVMHYTDAGLSMELRGLLDKSSLVDPSTSTFGMDQSFTGSLVPLYDGSTSIVDMKTDQQVSFYHCMI